MEPPAEFSGFLLLHGRGMSPGRTAGALVRNRRALAPASVANRILVAERAVPEDIDRILASSGTITLAATLLSHVSLLSREFGKPSVTFGPTSNVRLVPDRDGGALLALEDVAGGGKTAKLDEDDLVLLDGEAGTVAIPRLSHPGERDALHDLHRRLSAYGRDPDDSGVLATLVESARHGGGAVIPYLAEAALTYGLVARGDATRRLLAALRSAGDVWEVLRERIEEIGRRLHGEIEVGCREASESVRRTSDSEELERVLRSFESHLAPKFALLEDLALAGDAVEPQLDAVLRAADGRRTELRARLTAEVDSALEADDGEMRAGLGGWFRLLRRARAARLETERVDSLHRRLTRVLAEERKKAGTHLVFAIPAAGRMSRDLVGGKAAGLNEVAGLLVRDCLIPEGFVVTSAAYRLHLLGETGERVRVAARESRDRQELSRRARAAILGGAVPPEVGEAVAGALAGRESERMAVRSSATIEDGPATSLAGLFDTYLGVAGVEQVLERMRWAWASLWNARALAALDVGGHTPARAAQAVLLQRMVSTRIAGVLFTSDPSGLPDTMLISAWWGLGEGISQGTLRGDAFWVRRSTGALLAAETGDASGKVVLDPAAPGTIEVPLDPAESGRPCLGEEQLSRLAGLARALERGTGRVQDVEFGFDDAGSLYLFQIRRIVTARGT